MLIRKVRLLNREGLFDIRIVDGKFTEINSELEVIDGEEIIEGNLKSGDVVIITAKDDDVEIKVKINK